MSATEAIYERQTGHWHAVVRPRRSGFVPILCGIATEPLDDQGITWGSRGATEPTCPVCALLIQTHGSIARAVRALRGAQ